jgi:tyrosinase
VIQKAAIGIAEKYEGDQEEIYKLAALELRQPYWDWASNIIPPEDIINRETIVYNAPPFGEEMRMSNPFRRYTFSEPIDPSFKTKDEDWTKYQTTIRYPKYFQDDVIAMYE